MHATIPSPANAIAAVTHLDPWAWYAAQREQRPFAFDAALGVWIASSAEAVAAVLECPELGVRPLDALVPASLLDGPLGDLFPRLARMSDGPTQRATKGAIVAALQAVDLDALAVHSRRWAVALPPEQLQFDLSAHALGSLCGVPDAALPDLASAVRAFVVALAPGSSPAQVADGHLATETLSELLTPCMATPGRLLHLLAQQLRQHGVNDPLTALANSIALLQQASDATAGLIGLAVEQHLALHDGTTGAPAVAALLSAVLRETPPVHNTRRWALADVTLLGQHVQRGDGVLVLLAAASRDSSWPRPDPPLAFGRGAHVCPASAHARVIAQAAVERLLTPDDSGRLPLRPIADLSQRYEALANARIPRLQQVSSPDDRHAATDGYDERTTERSQP